MAHPIFKFVQSLLGKTEFGPFTIVLDSGERIQIESREFLMAIPGFELLLVHRPTDADVRVIDPGHVRELLCPDSQALAS